MFQYPEIIFFAGGFARSGLLWHPVSSRVYTHNCVHSCVHCYFKYLGTGDLVQGRVTRKGDLCRRTTVTLSVFKFRTWFFAQIVENRETRLSSSFWGPGDIFSKSYDGNQIWSKCSGGMRAPRRPMVGLEPAWDLTRARRASIQLPYKSGSRHNFSKNCPQDLKMS
jgi:hypothetical protein